MCRRGGMAPRDLYAKGLVRELQRRLGGDFPGNPDPARAAWRYVDDEDPAVRFTGGWYAKFCENGEQFGDKVHRPKGSEGRATYPLPVEKAGRFRLWGKVNYMWNVSRPSSTALTVTSGDARHSLEWDQTVLMGEWARLGEFDLAPGATVEIDVSRSTGTILADVFAVEPVNE